MAKTKPVKRGRASKKDQLNGNEYVLWKTETGIPLPARGPRDPEFKQKLLDKVDSIHVLQSFVIEKKKLHSARNILKEERPKHIFLYSVIKPEEKFARIHKKQ